MLKLSKWGSHNLSVDKSLSNKINIAAVRQYNSGDIK